jgi:ABC-type Fe3+-hydroxamate transport system substrate-binding protein
VLVAAVLSGCERKPPETPAETQPEPEVLARVVSLSPAITQILADMDQQRLVVGVGQNDAAAPADAAVVGTFADINSEALVETRPTHVLTMAGPDGPPAKLRELAAAKKFEVYAYPYPTTVHDVAEMIASDAELLPDAPMPAPRTTSLATVLSSQVPGATLLAQGVKFKMLNQLDALQKATADGGGPNVLMLIGTDPLTASAGGEVLHDVLTRYLNARNAAEGMSGGAPVLDREKLLSLKPDVILLLSPKAPELKSVEEDDRLGALRGLDVPAVKNERVVLINDPAVLLPSSTLPRVAEAMAKAIYPDLAGAIDAAVHTPLPPPTATQPDAPPGSTAPADTAR